MHPFLESNKLSDEEIMERLGRAYIHLNNQTALGHTITVQSIREVIHTLEAEHRLRMSRQVDEEIKKKNPNALAPIDIGKLEDNIRKFL